MRTILTIIMAAMSCISASAYKYAYSFENTPVSEAIIRISKDNPDVNISFIYKELDNVALNPVPVIRKGDNYYIEALQHGKFRYTGMALGGDNEPVAGATVMLLAPGDSSVVTYGVADAEGRFNIPCDRTEVIAKLSSIGYQTVYRHCDNFNIGIVTMPVRATVLKSVAVEAQMATVYSDKTVFIPTARQKNASQTGAELIDHIGIPQLKVFLNGRVETNSGRPVA